MGAGTACKCFVGLVLLRGAALGCGLFGIQGRLGQTRPCGSGSLPGFDVPPLSAAAQRHRTVRPVGWEGASAAGLCALFNRSLIKPVTPGPPRAAGSVPRLPWGRRRGDGTAVGSVLLLVLAVMAGSSRVPSPHGEQVGVGRGLQLPSGEAGHPELVALVAGGGEGGRGLCGVGAEVEARRGSWGGGGG